MLSMGDLDSFVQKTKELVNSSKEFQHEAIIGFIDAGLKLPPGSDFGDIEVRFSFPSESFYSNSLALFSLLQISLKMQDGMIRMLKCCIQSIVA